MRQQEWKGERLGRFTASEIGKLMVKGRAKDQYFGEGAITYIESRAAEILTQEPATDLEGMKAIEWGNTHEAECAALFAEKYPSFIYYGKENSKFFPYEPVKQWAGGSPDGIIPGRAVAEFKCPENSTHHIKYYRMKTGEDLKDLKPIYYAQIQFNMMCTKADLGYFASYDPRPLDRPYRLKILEVPYDKAYCRELDERLKRAVDELRVILIEDIMGKQVVIAHHDPAVNATIIEDANALKI
jgi:hypothetical protein